jgi:hypothetical protein
VSADAPELLADAEALAELPGSSAEAGRRYTMLDLSVTEGRPITHATGRVLCEGRLGHRGRTEATGTLLAQGRATLVLR